MNIDETLVGLAEIAIALAGFTGVVVAFGSRSEGAWHPGDPLPPFILSTNSGCIFLGVKRGSNEPRELHGRTR